MTYNGGNWTASLPLTPRRSRAKLCLMVDGRLRQPGSPAFDENLPIRRRVDRMHQGEKPADLSVPAPVPEVWTGRAGCP
jgi:hypothetical protein